MRTAPDTIAAPATPPGTGHRAVLRLSGPRAFRIAGLPRRAGARSFKIAGIAAEAWSFLAPRSYTREDVVELHLPAAAPLVREVLDRLLAKGARLAQPGEFTRRAFLNGRIDLAQAESVLDLVSARGAGEARAAARALRGGFSRDVGRIERATLDLCADVEAAIDFVDEDIEIIAPAAIARRAGEARSGTARILEELSVRRAETSKPSVFLVGPPNAGKSSLFNRLGGTAIVSAEAGTTRDVISADAGGFLLCDAPGLGAAEGVDAEAARRSREEAAHADLWLFVVDAADPAPAEALAGSLAGRAALLVINKVDRVPKAPDLRRRFGTGEALFTSAATGEGIPDLRSRLDRWASGAGAEGARARFQVSVRQRDHLREAERALARAEEAARNGAGLEFIAADLRTALQAFGSISGRSAGQDLLDRIFQRFCLGK